MVQFAIICLIVIILSLTHLLNWFYRKVNKGVRLVEIPDPTIILIIIVTGFYLGLISICFYNIILYGHALIN
jgi:hypothetical protein